MKEFFKFTFASMLGFILASLVVFIILLAMIVSAVSFSSKDTTSVPDKAILHITLDSPVNDRAPENPFATINFNDLEASRALGLNEILSTLHHAANDKKVKGIYLDLSFVPTDIATVEEIRNALIEFKKSGKFIISYSEMYTQKSYYLASISDKIYLNPAGSMEFKGLAGRVVFFKGMLEKLDIEPQVIRHGKFKSAVEPFILDKMSDESKEQTLTYVSAIWEQMLKGISDSRKVSRDQLNSIADNFLVQTPDDAVKHNLIDKLLYKDELLEELKNKSGANSTKDLKLVKFSRYIDSWKKNPDIKSGKDKIAVIYASGSIVSGEGQDGSLGSETISKAIRKARTDAKVKAIVLRVNSPGGSALASDVIWREVVLAKKEKPVIVSMGDVAASGGYYIACAATKIYANPNTLTGSIGVFGIIPNTQKANLKDYGIMNLPYQKDPFTRILEAFSGDQTSLFIKKQLGPSYDYFVYLKQMSQMQGVQAMMAYDIQVE